MLSSLTRVGVPVADGLPAASSQLTAVAFALEGGYLMPFKTMVYSMARTGTMVDAPVFVYSDDPRVFDDPVVRAVADRLVLIQGPLRDALYGIARDHIRRPERAAWNRGTCLKWAVFDDCDVEQILFLDVDMLCLGSLEDFLVMDAEAALVGAPQFPRALMADGDERASEGLLRERLEAMLAGTARRFMSRLNSGVMLVRGPLLSADAREQLLDFARRSAAVNEQSHLTSFFRDPDAGHGLKMRLVSSAYNFHESYLGRLDPVDALRLLPQVRVLHYAGSPKPWDAEVNRDSSLTTLLWWRFSRRARQHGMPLEMPPLPKPRAAGVTSR